MHNLVRATPKPKANRTLFCMNVKLYSPKKTVLHQVLLC